MIHSCEYLDAYMNSNLVINEKRKKELGEVMTPPALITQMLDTLPEWVWTDPTKRWLEPTCGSAHFMIMAYRRLMIGLSEWCFNVGDRSRHIIHNMLYMVDICPINVAKCRVIFGEYANIVCSDILLLTNTSFDFVIGNVPFQSHCLLGGKNKLYERVTDWCLSALSAGGFLLLIVPDNLFSGGAKIYKRLILHKVLNIQMIEPIHFPKIQQYMCAFLLEKVVGPCLTTMQMQMQIQLLDRPINPIRHWTQETERLAQKYISSSRNNAVYNRGKPLDNYVEDGAPIYTIIYTPTKFLTTSNKSYAVGIGIKKIVIFLISTNLEFKIDWTGEHGIGPNTFYIPFKDESEGFRWKQLLESQEYKELVLACKTCRQFISTKFMQHLYFKD